MLNHQLQPLEVNALTGEPFLRLKQHPNIIITPPRWSDAEAFLPHLNDPRVYKTMNNPPFPYTIEHGTEFLKTTKPASDKVFEQLAKAQHEPTLQLAESCAIQSIREVQSDGSDVLIGDICLVRFRHGDIMAGAALDNENKERNVSENERREPGDPLIIWEPGYWLAASHHGKGIMSDALSTLRQEWWVPRMKAHHLLGVALSKNEGSKKVFLKNKFRVKAQYDAYKKLSDGVHNIHLLEWKPGYT